MITIFTIPRPFTGQFDVIQRNAIRSWLRLEPKPEILLFEKSVPLLRQIAREFDVELFSVGRSPAGTPLITDALLQAQEIAKHDILCMANTDNIYMSDLPPAVQFIASQFEQFLMVGQRWNLNMTTELEITVDGRRWQIHQEMTEILEFQEDWEDDLRQRALAQDDIEHVGAIDYLIWRGNFYQNLPPLAVGQKGYDSLLVWLANQAEIPVVDVTQVVMVIHQDHPATFRVEETSINDFLITQQYGPDVRGGITHSGYRLFSDRLVNRATEEAIPWKR